MNKLIFYAVVLLAITLGIWVTITYHDFFVSYLSSQTTSSSSTQRKAPLGIGAPGNVGPAIAERKQRQSPFGTTNPWAAAPEKQRKKGQIVVSDPPAQFEDQARLLGFKIIETVRLKSLGMRILRLRIPRGSTITQAIGALRTHMPGLDIDANHTFDPSSDDTPVAAPPRPAYSSARALAGWQNVAANCGKGIRIGIIDSGVDLLHPALKNSHIVTQSFHTPRHKPGQRGHGTAVAAEIVGSAKWGGLLPGATLYAANMFEVNENGGETGSVVGLAKSLDWMAQEHLQVVNLSIAGADNRIVRKVIARSAAQGMILVAAAGNWGPRSKPAYPAAYDDVIAVTATAGEGAIYFHANQGDYIEFSEPGVGLWTAVPGGGKTQSGTSFAAPMVTVLAALKAHRDGVQANTEAVRAFLRKYAHDLGRPGRDPVFGWGLTNILPYCAP
ncbi:S8 family serine peptidase [Varunaivibrio sulfuroxidans]|uniref:Subtilase family protein n=1 Tax=Varunaivibrio sulfuroxidans TaxID=1773489 RepID=A0A4R3JDH2_9PROT|nr:S8 family serine peptidase [Varunaivibrio sulfuroxidans]TCS64089.1 subtilase family protein [Varunaivibrio sulfuroxidans]WES31461.1 S8 family serine peptidase [Varunaivibrio sulfuroxidans]